MFGSHKNHEISNKNALSRVNESIIGDLKLRLHEFDFLDDFKRFSDFGELIRIKMRESYEINKEKVVFIYKQIKNAIKNHIFGQYDSYVKTVNGMLEEIIAGGDDIYTSFRKNLLAIEQSILKIEKPGKNKKEEFSDNHRRLSRINRLFPDLEIKNERITNQIKKAIDCKPEIEFDMNSLLSQISFVSPQTNYGLINNESDLLLETMSDYQSGEKLGLLDDMDDQLSPKESQRTPKTKVNRLGSSFIKKDPIKFSSLVSNNIVNQYTHERRQTDMLGMERFAKSKNKNFMSIENLHIKNYNTNTNIYKNHQRKDTTLTKPRRHTFYQSINEFDPTVINYRAGNERNVYGSQVTHKRKEKGRSLSVSKNTTADLTNLVIDSDDLKNMLFTITQSHKNISRINFKNNVFKCDVIDVFEEFFDEPQKNLFFIDLKGNEMKVDLKNFRKRTRALYDNKVKLIV